MPNLIPIPSNAFSGAAVKWDNAPVDRALLQNTQAKQQASQLALDKYFDKQANQLTGTGMDMQNDGEDFIKLKNAWQEHALANRRAIVNPSIDGGKAAMESQARFNEARQFVQKSIQKVKNSQAAYKILSDPAKAALLTDHARDQLHHGTLGLNDPEYVPVDLNSVAFNPKPWGTADEAGLSNEVAKIKGTAKDREPVQDAKSGTQVVTTDTTFGKDDLTGMYNSGAQRYYSSPGFKGFIDNIPKNPIQFQDLNGLFKTHFGRDVQTGEDLAAAYALSKNPNARSVDKTSPIPSYSNIAQGKKLQVAGVQSAITLGREKALSDYNTDKKDEKAAKATPDTEAMLGEIEKGAVTKKIQPFSNRGQQDAGYSVPITPEMKTAFKKVVGGHVEEPDDIKYKPNTGEYTAIWFKKDPETKATVKTAGGSSVNSESLPPVTLPRATIKDEYDKTHLTKGTVAPPSKTESKSKGVSAEDVKKKYGITY
jgi:hypothetical protein